jgi:hypothetical protein
MHKKSGFVVLGLMLLAVSVCEADEKGSSRGGSKISRAESSSSSSSSMMVGPEDAQGTLVVKDMPHQLTSSDVTFKLFFDRTRIYMSKGSLGNEIHLTIPKSLVDTKQLMGAPMHYTVTHDKTNTVEAYGSCEMPVGARLNSRRAFEVTIDGSKLKKKSLEGFDVLIPECRVSLH